MGPIASTILEPRRLGNDGAAAACSGSALPWGARRRAIVDGNTILRRPWSAIGNVDSRANVCELRAGNGDERRFVDRPCIGPFDVEAAGLQASNHSMDGRGRRTPGVHLLR